MDRLKVFKCPECVASSAPHAEVKWDLSLLMEHYAKVHMDRFYLYSCPQCRQRLLSPLMTKVHLEKCKKDNASESGSNSVTSLPLHRVESSQLNVLQKAMNDAIRLYISQNVTKPELPDMVERAFQTEIESVTRFTQTDVTGSSFPSESTQRLAEAEDDELLDALFGSPRMHNNDSDDNMDDFSIRSCDASKLSDVSMKEVPQRQPVAPNALEMTKKDIECREPSPEPICLGIVKREPCESPAECRPPSSVSPPGTQVFVPDTPQVSQVADTPPEAQVFGTDNHTQLTGQSRETNITTEPTQETVRQSCPRMDDHPSAVTVAHKENNTTEKLRQDPARSAPDVNVPSKNIVAVPSDFPSEASTTLVENPVEMRNPRTKTNKDTGPPQIKEKSGGKKDEGIKSASESSHLADSSTASEDGESRRRKSVKDQERPKRTSEATADLSTTSEDVAGSSRKKVQDKERISKVNKPLEKAARKLSRSRSENLATADSESSATSSKKGKKSLLDSFRRDIAETPASPPSSRRDKSTEEREPTVAVSREAEKGGSSRKSGTKDKEKTVTRATLERERTPRSHTPTTTRSGTNTKNQEEKATKERTEDSSPPVATTPRMEEVKSSEEKTAPSSSEDNTDTVERKRRRRGWDVDQSVTGEDRGHFKKRKTLLPGLAIPPAVRKTVSGPLDRIMGEMDGTSSQKSPDVDSSLLVAGNVQVSAGLMVVKDPYSESPTVTPPIGSRSVSNTSAETIPVDSVGYVDNINTGYTLTPTYPPVTRSGSSGFFFNNTQQKRVYEAARKQQVYDWQNKVMTAMMYASVVAPSAFDPPQPVPPPPPPPLAKSSSEKQGYETVTLPPASLIPRPSSPPPPPPPMEAGKEKRQEKEGGERSCRDKEVAGIGGSTMTEDMELVSSTEVSPRDEPGGGDVEKGTGEASGAQKSAPVAQDPFELCGILPKKAFDENKEIKKEEAEEEAGDIDMADPMDADLSAIMDSSRKEKSGQKLRPFHDETEFGVYAADCDSLSDDNELIIAEPDSAEEDENKPADCLDMEDPMEMVDNNPPPREKTINNRGGDQNSTAASLQPAASGRVAPSEQSPKKKSRGLDSDDEERQRSSRHSSTRDQRGHSRRDDSRGDSRRRRRRVVVSSSSESDNSSADSPSRVYVAGQMLRGGRNGARRDSGSQHEDGHRTRRDSERHQSGAHASGSAESHSSFVPRSVRGGGRGRGYGFRARGRSRGRGRYF